MRIVNHKQRRAIAIREEWRRVYRLIRDFYQNRRALLRLWERAR